MNKKIKYLSKNTLLFFISSFLPKVLSFFLVPLYTHFLSTDDYGTYDLIITTASLLIPIFSLCIQDAVIRFGMEKKVKKEDVFSSALRINIVGLLIVTVLAYIFYKLNFLAFPSYFYLYIVIFYFLNAINNMFDFFCKAIEKVKEIVVSSCIKTVLILSLNIFFIVFLKQGLLGLLYSYLFGLLFSIIYLFFSAKLYNYISFNYNSNLTSNMIMFSTPLIFSSIAWWINSSSDRYILTWLIGTSANGIYSISYKIPSIISTFSTVFNNAWSISSIKEFDKEDSDGFFGLIYTMMNIVLVILCSIIMIVNIPISTFFYAKQFNSAWFYIPPLLISVLYSSLLLFITGVFRAVKDSKSITIAVIAGAFINTFLNFILISLIGAYGAALATLVGYFVSLTIAKNKLKKYITMKINNLEIYLSYLVLLIQMILAYFGNIFLLFQFVCLISIIIIYRKNLKNTINFIIKKVCSHTIK